MIVGLLVIGLALLATQLGRVRVYEGRDFAMLRDRAFTPLLVEFTYKRRVFEVLLDVGLVSVAYYGSYVIRFDRDLPQYYDLFVASLPIVIACQLLSFFALGVYRGLWRFLTAGDLLTYFKGVTLGTVCSVITLVYLYRFTGYSRSVFIIYAMALLLLLAASRYSFRVIGELAHRRRPGTQRVAIYGAGEGGALLVRELWRNPRYDYRLVGFFDDDLSKAGKRLDGLPVFGGDRPPPSHGRRRRHRFGHRQHPETGPLAARRTPPPLLRERHRRAAVRLRVAAADWTWAAWSYGVVNAARDRRFSMGPFYYFVIGMSPGAPKL